MNEILAIFILLTELFMLLQCLQSAFKQELEFDRYLVGLILADFVIYLGINLKLIPIICSCLFYVVIYMYCYFKFGCTVKKTIIRLIIGFSLVGCIQGIVACITNGFRDTDNSLFILALSSFIALIFSYFIRKILLFLDTMRIIKRDNEMFVVGILYGLAFVGLLVDYYLNKSKLNVYSVCILAFLVFMIFYMGRLGQAEIEIEKKNYEIELQKIYGSTYEKLLSEIRRRQHDYRNQLSAIYSMHLTARSLEELVQMQKEYGDVLQLDCKFDSILTGCDNTILAGYIYHKCISCENQGISIDYNIHIRQAACSFALHEIVEILGILIDNACESINGQICVNKQVYLGFKEEDEKIIIMVANPTKYVTFSEIEKMFVCGYSSKGEGRGIGLARVKELIKKYNVEMKVFNSIINEDNWINFMIEIIK
ncbi:MAG: GHKL domain-containing protein [Lachnospiraceae bacterium]|nr:GHKL domain-containing protein [Lachnospiraceae bacterium]